MVNQVHADVVCPRCGRRVQAEIEVDIGAPQEVIYSIGSDVAWVPRKAPQNGGRPLQGTGTFEGYTECPLCEKDFFTRIVVDADRIVHVEPDLTKRGYIPDAAAIQALENM